MSIGRSHSSDAAHDAELAKLLDNGEFAKAVAAYDREDCDHDIPYGGGSGTDGRTIFWDRRICAAIEGGQFKLDGKAIDPRTTGKVHEAIEGACIRLWELCAGLLGWSQTGEKYPRAHDVANAAERHAVVHHGWDWDEYQDQWKKLIEPIEKAPIENPPDNLLLEPYVGTPLHEKLAAMIASTENGDAKLSHAAVHYGLAKPRGDKCSACEHFRGKDDCEIVVAPIYPGGWCDRFESKAEEAAESNNGPVEEHAEADHMAHGRAIAGAKALHAVGHISAKERDKHMQASQAALGKPKPRKPFVSWAQ